MKPFIISLAMTAMAFCCCRSMYAQCGMMNMNHADAASSHSGKDQKAGQDSLTVDTFKVYGNCGMCKSRIEKALKAEGVEKATWNTETKMITVAFDGSKTSGEKIHQLIAEAGHDTEQLRADDTVYNKLPGCCRYERKAEAGKEEKNNEK